MFCFVFFIKELFFGDLKWAFKRVLNSHSTLVSFYFFFFFFSHFLIYSFLSFFLLLFSDDDGWGEEDALEAPKYLFAAVVVKEYIPPTYTHLTLELDHLVYVFKTVLISFFFSICSSPLFFLLFF